MQNVYIRKKERKEFMPNLVAYRHRRAVSTIISALILLLLLPAAPAWSDLLDNLKLSTFGTLGGVLLDDSDLIPSRNVGRPSAFNGKASWKQDSMLGLQLDVNLKSNFGAHLQLVFQDRANNNLDNHIEWAYLHWTPTPAFTVRAGRLGTDFYMLSDYRNVSYAYLWQRPPPEFYAPVLPQNVDGLDASYSWQLPSGKITFKAFGGASDLEITTNEDQPNSTAKMKPLYGASLNFETLNWRIALGYSQTTFDSCLESLAALIDPLESAMIGAIWQQAPALARDLSTKDRDMRFYSLGVAYDKDDWVLQAEIGYLDSEWKLLPSIKSAYLSIGRHCGDWTPYVLLSRAVSEAQDINVTPPPSGFGLEPIYENILMALEQFPTEQTTLSLGTRIDIGAHLAFKVQWDHTWVEEGHAMLFWHDAATVPSPKTEVDAISVSINWMFSL